MIAAYLALHTISSSHAVSEVEAKGHDLNKVGKPDLSVRYKGMHVYEPISLSLTGVKAYTALQ